MTTKTLYLAGPMTGIPAFNFPAFTAAAAHLRSLGHQVISPAEHQQQHGLNTDGMTGNELPPGFDLEETMLWDLQQVTAATAIAVLPGWDKSRGARAEVALAAALGKPAILVLNGINETPVLIEVTARELSESIVADHAKRPTFDPHNPDTERRNPHPDGEELEADSPPPSILIHSTAPNSGPPLEVADSENRVHMEWQNSQPDPEPEVWVRANALYPRLAARREKEWAPIRWGYETAMLWERLMLTLLPHLLVAAGKTRSAALWARRTAARAWAGIVAAATVYKRLSAAQARVAYLEDEIKAEEDEHDITMRDLHATRGAADSLRESAESFQQAANGVSLHLALTYGPSYTEELASRILHGDDPNRATTSTVLLQAAAFAKAAKAATEALAPEQEAETPSQKARRVLDSIDTAPPPTVEQIAGTEVNTPPTAVCDRCGRTTAVNVIGDADTLMQPDGLPCGGLFTAIAGA